MKKTGDPWLSRRAAAAELGVSERRISQIADAGHIATKSLPGVPPRFSASDIASLESESVRPRRTTSATQNSEAGMATA